MNTFHTLGLNDSTLKAIDEMGFVTPTNIQEKTIPLLIRQKTDLIALAQTGTGKTAAFGLPILQDINLENRNLQSLILSPTRELALQITKDLETFAKYHPNIKIIAVYGGADIDKQIKAVKRGGHIIVGTPGRVLDLIKRKVLDFSKIETLVLDEADEMLSMGFKDDLDAILAGTPDSKHTWLFSATMPKDIAYIARKYMTDPQKITAEAMHKATETIEHFYYMVQAKHKYLALKRVVDLFPAIYGIVFCRTRHETKEIAEKLIADGYNADALHGDLSQAQREHVMGRFRIRNLQILVATDVAARGLDVNDLTHVINMHLPDVPEIYVHRSGRTGRAGKAGIAISIIHTREKSSLRSIEQKLGAEITYKKIPEGREICEKQLFNLIDKVKQVKIEHHQIESFLPDIYQKLDNLSREELIQRFVSVEFNRFLEYYRNTVDLDISPKTKGRDEREGRKDRKDRNKSEQQVEGFTRYFVAVGKKHGLTVPKLIALINEKMRDRNMTIGDIDLQRAFSFFEIDSNYDQKMQQNFVDANWQGNALELGVAETPPPSKERPQSKERGPRKKRNKKSFKKY